MIQINPSLPWTIVNPNKNSQWKIFRGTTYFNLSSVSFQSGGESSPLRCRLLSENKYFVPLFIFLISLINITKDTKNHSQCQVLFIWKGDYIGVPQNKIPYSCGFAPPHHCKIPCFWVFLRVGGKVGLRTLSII